MKMFERFTERARQVIVLAQEEARTRRHTAINTNHLLLGLIREEEGIAARVLFEANVTHARANQWLGSGISNPPDGQIPFADEATHAIELSLREALSLGQNYIGTEHLLLGIVRKPCRALDLIASAGADVETIRNSVIRAMSRRRPSAPAAPLKVTLTLSPDTARWLLDEVGKYIHTHEESGEIYHALKRALATS